MEIFNLTSIKGSAIFKPVLNFNDPKSTIVSYKTKIPNNSWVRYMSYGLINGEFKIVRYQVKVYEEILKSAARDNKSLFAPGNDALKVRIEWVEVRNDFKVPNVHLALKVRIEWVEVRNDFKVPNVHLETVKNGYPCDLKQLQEMHAASGLNLEIALQRETLKANEEWAKRSQKLLKVNDNIGVFE